MREAVVLENGYIVYLDTITDDSVYNPETTEIVFNARTGRVIGFTKDEVTYMATYNTVTYEFKRYVNSLDFWNSAYPNGDSYKVSWGNFSLDERVFRVEGIIGNWDIYNRYGPGVKTGNGVDEGTTVIMVIEEMGVIGTINILKKSFTFPNRNLKENENFYQGLEGFNDYQEHEIVNGYFTQLQMTNPLIINYSNEVFLKEYRNEDGTFSFTSSDAVIVDEINFLLYKILEFIPDFKNYLNDENLYAVFQKHLEIINERDPNNPELNEAQTFYHGVYTERYFNLLRIRLIELKYWVYGVDFNSIDKNDVIVRIIGLFGRYELSALPYLTKMEFLQNMIEGNWWLSGRWNPLYSGTKLTEEEVVIKIIRSIPFKNSNGHLNYDEIDDFITKLLTKPWWVKETSVETLFELLYSKINDAVFFGDDGTGARGNFVRAVLSLWKESKFNPYRERTDITEDPEDVVTNALSHFEYTSVPANILKETGIGVDLIDEDAAPMLLSYNAKRALLWNINDFSFEIEGNKIIAEKEYVTGRVITNSGNSILIKSFKLYGTYNIMQPVALGKIESNDANEYLVKMPFQPVDGTFLDPNNPNKDFLNNCFPIFYLMYLDDVAAISNTKESIGLALDVVLTFTGVGNIPKLRHLRHGANIAYKWFKNGYSTLSVIEKARIAKLGVQLFSTADAFVASMNILWGFYTAGCGIYHNPSTGQIEPVPQEPQPEDPNYDTLLEAYNEYMFCKELDSYFFATEMFLLVGNLASLRALKRAGLKLKKRRPANLDASTGQVVDDIAGNIAEFVQEFLNRIENEFPNLHSWLNNLNIANADLASDLMLILDELPNDVLKQLNLLSTSDLNLIDNLTLLKEAIDNAKFIVRDTKLFNIPYVIRKMKNRLTPRMAYYKYGQKAKELVIAVDDEFSSVFQNFSSPKIIREKVMVSGMAFHSDKYSSPTFVFTNFTKKEVGLKNSVDGKYYKIGSNNTEISEYQNFLDNELDDIIKKRIDSLVDHKATGDFSVDNALSPLETTAITVQKAAEMARHGEVRALNALIKHMKEVENIQVTDEMLKNVIAYNRKMIGKNKGTMPTCFHCHFLTDLVTFLTP